MFCGRDLVSQQQHCQHIGSISNPSEVSACVVQIVSLCSVKLLARVVCSFQHVFCEFPQPLLCGAFLHSFCVVFSQCWCKLLVVFCAAFSMCSVSFLSLCFVQLFCIRSVQFLELVLCNFQFVFCVRLACLMCILAGVMCSCSACVMFSSSTHVTCMFQNVLCSVCCLCCMQFFTLCYVQFFSSCYVPLSACVMLRSCARPA